MPVPLRDMVPFAVVAAGVVALFLLICVPTKWRWTAPLILLALPLWLLALGVVWPVTAAPLPPRLPTAYVLDRVRVVDVVAGTVTSLTAITVRDGRIVAIGDAVSGLPRIDGGNSHVMPGLWDMHIHSFATTPQLGHALMLSMGITSVRDMMDCAAPGDPLVACIDVKRAWTRQADAGDRAAPRYVGMASFYYNSPSLAPADIPLRVAADVRRGVTALKVYNDLQAATYEVLATESRRVGLPMVGHLPRAVPLERAIDLRQRSFEHARILPDACGGAPETEAAPPDRLRATLARFDAVHCSRLLDALANSGAALVPTHVTREDDARAHQHFDPGLDWLDPLSRWAWLDDQASTRSTYPGASGAALLRAYHRRGLALTGMAHRRGIPILVGTDAVPVGLRYHDELALLARAGLTPPAVLRAATNDAARFAGMDDHSGQVAPGYVADLLLLPRNPISHISAVRDLRGMIFAGRYYGPADLDALRTYTRNQARHPANWAKLLWGVLVSPSSSEL